MQPTQGTDPVVSDLAVPMVVYSKSTKQHLIAVKVTDPQGLSNIEDVTYAVTKTGSSTIITQGDLLDDGFSGDVIAKDSVFSASIQGSFVQGDSGSFEVTTFALDKDGNRSNSLTSQVFVLGGVEDERPVVLNVSGPKTVPIDSAHQFIITAQITDDTGLGGIRSVSYRFYPPESPNPVQEGTLVDDGTLGDITPGDGVFSVRLESSLFKRLNDYFVRILAEDSQGNKSSAKLLTIRGRNRFNAAPVIASVVVPKIVKATETSEVTITARVTDTDGLSDIDSVTATIFTNDQQELPISPLVLLDNGDETGSGDATAGDGTFSSKLHLSDLSSEAAAYRLVFSARDKSDRVSNIIGQQLVVTFSDAPFILNLNAPELVQIDPNRPQRLLITLDVRDPQGIANIDSVWFRSFLPNGNEAGNSPIVLFDEGNNDDGDAIANDGIYSRFVNLPATGVELGDYRWLFMARDAEGNNSNQIEHIVTVR